MSDRLSFECVRRLLPLLVVITLAWGIIGCSAVEERVALPEQRYLLPAGSEVFVNISGGTVHITFGDFNELLISGEVNEQVFDQLVVFQNHNLLEVRFEMGKGFGKPSDPNPIRLTLQVPQETFVRFDSFDAALYVTGTGQGLDVTSTSGDVLVDRFTGKAVIKANRGDVRVEESQGAIDVFANYGLIEFLNVHGTTNAVNILGKIQFSGRPSTGDNIRLETDHGSVRVSTHQDPNLNLDLQTTSGEVVCLVKDVIRTPRSCWGTLGNGEAELFVKTVSGKVFFQINPLVP